MTWNLNNTDAVIYYSSASQSRGGAISANKVPSNNNENFFKSIDLAEAMLGSTVYWGGYVKNDNATETGRNFCLFIDPNTEHPEDEINIGLEPVQGSSPRTDPYFVATGTTYEQTADSPDLQLTRFTLCAWFKGTVLPSPDEGFLICKGGTGSEVAGQNLTYGLWMESTGKIKTGFETSAGADNYVTSSASWNDGNWHFAVGSYDGTQVQLLIDNVSKGTFATTSTPDLGTNPLRIGANSRVLDGFYTGNIDEVRVYNRALTSQEKSDLYLTGIVPSSGLVLEKTFGNPIPSMQTIATINTAPTNVEFFLAPTYNQGVFIGELKPGQGRGFWLRRIITTTREEWKRNLFDVCIGFDPPKGSTGTGSGSGTGGGGGGANPGPVSGDFSVGFNGDWGTSSGTKSTIDNIDGIMDSDPTFKAFFSLGDNSYKSTGDKWIDMTKKLLEHDRRLWFVPGNHDYDDGKGLIKQYQTALSQPAPTWFQITVGNMLILGADCYKSFTSGSEQYKFLKKAMEDNKNNTSIVWRVLIFHEPMYSGKSKHGNNAKFRDIYHPLCDANGFDFMLYGHNHNYQRSYPMKYNSSKPSAPTYFSTNDPNYTNPTGVIAMTIGLGGHDIVYGISDSPNWNAFQEDSYFGFFMMTVWNSGRSLTGKAYKNNHDLFDTFTITK